MNKEKIQKSFKKNDLETSRLILGKLIKHYSYDSIVEYLLNPNKINNPKLELIMKRLINKIGVDTLALLLCNENLNSYNINNEKEEEKTIVKSNYENEKTRSKFKASIKKIRKKYKNKIIKDNSKNELYKYNHKYKFKKKKNYYNNEDYNNINDNTYKYYKNNISSSNHNSNSSSNSNINSSNEMSEESESENKDNISSNNICNSMINSNISSNYNNFNDLDDFSEFCDSNINNEDIIDLVNEMEEDDESEIKSQKEEEKKIILDETNSYVYKIIYKEPINGELYYYCYESINEDKTINMKCIDEECKSKGIYNSNNKQIIILVQHTIIYEDHCYLKPNFGGEELNLEIFDFIKDSPEITGIEILKSNNNYKINKKYNKIKNSNKDNEDNLMSDDNNEVENIINEELNENDNDDIMNDDLMNENEEKKNDDEPIFQNRISNNIKQIIQIDDNDDNNIIIKEKNKKENFTLIDLTNLTINNNSNGYNFKKNRLNKKNKNNNLDFIKKEKDENYFDSSKELNNKNIQIKREPEYTIKKEVIHEENDMEKLEENRNNINYYIKKEKIEESCIENDIKKKEENKNEIKEENRDKNNNNKNKEIKKEDNKDNNNNAIENKEEQIIDKKNEKKEEEDNKKEKKEDNNNEKKEDENKENQKNNNENLDISYNYIEFNMDNVKKLEGTKNSYSNKVYKINLQNKKNVEEERRSKSRRTIRKSEERHDKSRNRNHQSKSRSRSRSPSYLVLNENENDNNNEKNNESEIDNDLDNDMEEESEISQLSVISHIKNKKTEEKIIIDENDSFFSMDLLSEKEREKYNKRLNDETILLSDDSEKRKRLERMQKKYQEKHLKNFFKKNKFKKLYFKVNERIIRDEEIVNKRRIFGIIRKSFSPNNSIIEENEKENQEKNDIVENVENAENNDKKRLPIFGIYNPNKHNPKFFVDNLNKK